MLDKHLVKENDGIKLRGITPISDREGIIDSSMDRISESVYGRQALSIKGFVQEFKSLPKPEVPDDIKIKLQSFIEVMKDKGIAGNNLTT